MVEHLFGLDEIDRMTREVEFGDASVPYMRRVLAATRTEPRADPTEVTRVPAKGSTLVVCNHPLGGADSVAPTRASLRTPCSRVFLSRASR
jgi:putative hemolysin